jgi:hypothetical protein
MGVSLLPCSYMLLFGSVHVVILDNLIGGVLHFPGMGITLVTCIIHECK